MPRHIHILRHAATAIAVVAALLWCFRVHAHMFEAVSGHADHSSEACGILGLLDGEQPEPAADDDHCDCPGTACAPPQSVAIACHDGGLVARLLPGRLVIPEGLLFQPDPPPVRSI